MGQKENRSETMNGQGTRTLITARLGLPLRVESREKGEAVKVKGGEKTAAGIRPSCLR